MSRRRSIAVAVAAILLVAVAAVVTARTLRVSTSVTHFLASDGDRRLSALSEALPASESARSMVFVVDAPELATALAAAGELAAFLDRDPAVAWARAGSDPEIERALYAYYLPRRFAFARPDPAATARLVTPEGIDAALARLRRSLAGPLSPLAKRIAPRDPWLLHLDRLRALEAANRGGPVLSEGRFVTRDGKGAVVLAATAAPPFDTARQRPFHRRLEAFLRDLRSRHGPGLSVQRSSIHRLALWSEDVIRRDVQRISGISTVGIVLVFALLFRSLRLLLAASVPLAGGIVAGAFVTNLLFGEIHGLTLAFGATLIGVAIDYPVHLFTHLRGGGTERAACEVLRRVMPGIRLGALTTVAGFAGLSAASFPAVREMGIFASTGVLAALLLTRYAVPGLVAPSYPPVFVLSRAAAAAGRWLRRDAKVRAMGLVLLAVGASLSVVGLGRMRWQDDARALQRLSPELLEQDARVRSRVLPADASRFVAAFGPDLETALARNDAAAVRLDRLAREGAVRHRSLHAFLWSEELQRANIRVFEDAGLPDRLRDGLTRAGFVPGAFAPAFADLRGEKPVARWDEMAEGPLSPMVAPFRIDLPGGPALLTLLVEVRDEDALKRAVADLDGVVYFDQRAFLAEVYGRYRRRIASMVLAGLAAVVLLLLVRYRSLRTAAAALLPALLAAGGSLSILTLAGVELSMLHLVACLLVLSMGVDYGVFLAEAGTDAQDQGATVVSIAVACASTVLGFGLLAMSAQPALRAIGSTTGLGVLLAFVLAPTTRVLLSSRNAAP